MVLAHQDRGYGVAWFPMSEGRRTVSDMTRTLRISVAIDLDESCPRCDSTFVRVVDYGIVPDLESSESWGGHGGGDAVIGEPSPIFDCRECGFAWGELVRERMD